MLSQSVSRNSLSDKYYYTVILIVKFSSSEVERVIVKESEGLGSTSYGPCGFGFPNYEVRASVQHAS